MMCRIFLTGFMGCGKSTIGAELAKQLSLEFIDLDDRIVDRAGMSVEQIFREQGEEAFRERESKALMSLPGGIVCALGGGTLMREANLSWALWKSWIIYIRVGAAELVRRLQADATVRPLLLDRNGEPLSQVQMEMRIRDLVRQREPIYNQAHRILDLGGVTPEFAAARCRDAYRSRKV